MRQSRVTDVLDDLQWRGLIALSTDLDALRADLAKGPLTYYCGFDPTAPSLHFGNLLQILTVSGCNWPATARSRWSAAPPA